MCDLARSYEALVRDRVKFRVGRIVYLAFSRDERVLGFAFPKEEREALIASDPAKFLLPPASDLRFNWVCVRLDAIDRDEMEELVLDAWRMAAEIGAATVRPMAQPLRFGVVHDFRSPPGSDTPLPQIYAEAMEQIELVDRWGLDLVWFTEHHFLDDGHLPNFVPMAGAVAARTERVRISTDICLLPFAHPLRLAEDLAVLDNLSGGRMELGLGMGYAEHEFRAFGIPRSRRVSLMEEGIEILRRAWSGERFTFEGKRWRFEDVAVTPRPVQPGGPPLWIAGMSEASAERAARFDTHLLPQGARTVVLDPWRAQLRAAGRDPGDYRVGLIRSCFVTDDPERDWVPIKAAERYRMSVYARFFAETPDRLSAFDRDQQSIPQGWIVGDVGHCVRELTAFVQEYGITDIVTWGAAPGLPPRLLTPSLERFATEVVPAVRAAVGAGAPSAPAST